MLSARLMAELSLQVPTLTNEGGILKRDRRLQRGVDYEIVPDSLWKALALWYGKGTFALPRTVSPFHCILILGFVHLLLVFVMTEAVATERNCLFVWCL